MKIIRTIALLLLLAATFGGGYLLRARRPPAAAAPGARRVLYYVDPMHPAYRSDKPGTAPDCGMALEPVYEDTGGVASGTAAPAARITHYRDPGKPGYTSAKPGVNPETGNTLEPVYDAPVADAGGTVRVSADRQQLAGVTFATVQEEGGTRSLRMFGKVAYDETRVAHVHPRFEGWIESVFAEVTGAVVQKGQPLVSIYSPEMLASQQEMLLAARAQTLMRDNPLDSAARSSDSLLAAARRRLELWSLSPAELDQVLKSGEPIHAITITAPITGLVMERKAFLNQKVTPDSDLYTLVDASRVWVLASLQEADASQLRLNTHATVTLPYAGGATLHARVDFIQPQVDPTTRTLTVRLDVPNPGLRLKPEMFVNVDLESALPLQLTVPSDAVLDAGTRQTVYVDLGDGRFEPRSVRVGERRGGRLVILDGLKAGERVVASGTFIIDSESQLRGAPAGKVRP